MSFNGRCGAILTLTFGLLLPGALAAQQPASVSIPSLRGVRAPSPRGPDVRPPAAGPDLTSRGLSALRPVAAHVRDVMAPMHRGTSPAVAESGSRPAEPPSVLDAVFALTRPPDAPDEDARESLGSLGDVLPRELCRDLLELRARVQRARTVLFGQRGILRWGRLEGNERLGRIRLNLQADPDPGIRVTLVTR